MENLLSSIPMPYRSLLLMEKYLVPIFVRKDMAGVPPLYPRAIEENVDIVAVVDHFGHQR